MQAPDEQKLVNHFKEKMIFTSVICQILPDNASPQSKLSLTLRHWTWIIMAKRTKYAASHCYYWKSVELVESQRSCTPTYKSMWKQSAKFNTGTGTGRKRGFFKKRRGYFHLQNYANSML